MELSAMCSSCYHRDQDEDMRDRDHHRVCCALITLTVWWIAATYCIYVSILLTPAGYYTVCNGYNGTIRYVLSMLSSGSSSGNHHRYAYLSLLPSM